MASYTIHATITAEVAGASGDDDRSTIQAAVDAGVKELPGVAARYGFRVTDVSTTVEER